MKLKITNSAKQAIFFQFLGYPRHHPQIILSFCKGFILQTTVENEY